MKIMIMDTTLRDGEQTPHVAFTSIEKFNIARMLLEDINVDRIEIASARVSKGEFDAVKKITDWAKENNKIDRIEILGFVDNLKSIEWIYECGGRRMNLLSKGSLKHLTMQLKKTKEEHVEDILKTLKRAKELDVSVNLYLEDWSNGIKDSKEYVFYLINELKNSGIKRFMLPDTLGVLDPQSTYTFCKMMVEKFPDVKFDFHGHNDYELAVANSLMAVKAGVDTVHTTVNGIGERAGNTSLASVVTCIHDFCGYETNINEINLLKISKLVEAFTGIRAAFSMPVVGENVFTQCCGVHADGDKKGNLYVNSLTPERFGRKRQYSLGKTSGKANISQNLLELGIEIDDKVLAEVTKKVVELGDKKESITKEDLSFIVSDIIGSNIEDIKIKLVNYYICHANLLKPVATICVDIEGDIYQDTATGDGQYDAFMNAITKIYKKIGKSFPELYDYIVKIPPGGSTSALVETTIIWGEVGEFRTKGLDSDQTASAIEATMKMLNYIEMNK